MEKESTLKRMSISLMIPLALGFIGWLFTVERSITIVKVNQANMSANIEDMKEDISSIRENFEWVLKNKPTLSEGKTDGNHYANQD